MTVTLHVPYSLLVVLAAVGLLGLTCLVTRPRNYARVVDLEPERVRRALTDSAARGSAAARSGAPSPRSLIGCRGEQPTEVASVRASSPSPLVGSARGRLSSRPYTLGLVKK